MAAPNDMPGLSSLDRAMCYNVLYALAAKDGREEALFGPSAPRAFDAFCQSIPGSSFPELWFELPLAGDPWFDLHVLTSRNALTPGETYSPDQTGGHPDLFAWFARQESARQLALSWDVGMHVPEGPAVQLLARRRDLKLMCDFLRHAGRPDATQPLSDFVRRLPDGWFACYVGVFPERLGSNVRVECIPRASTQRAYAQDPSLLELHLSQTGLGELGDTLVPRCQLLAQTPFCLEFQFDVSLQGRAETTVGASVRFSPTSQTGRSKPFDPHGEAGALMHQLEEWGLVDERWKLLAGTSFATRVTRGQSAVMLYCFPAFVKLRWRDGLPLDAKAYLMAGAQ